MMCMDQLKLIILFNFYGWLLVSSLYVELEVFLIDINKTLAG